MDVCFGGCALWPHFSGDLVRRDIFRMYLGASLGMVQAWVYPMFSKVIVPVCIPASGA